MGPHASSPFSTFVERLCALSPLGEEEQTALLGLSGSILQVRAGVDLVPPGEKATFVHLIVEGLVGRFAQFSDGKRQITAVHLPLDVADLHSVARPALAPALQALTTTTLVRVPLATLSSLTRSSPTIAEAFWAYCAVDIAILERWAANLGCRAATQRMAHFLCEVALRIEDAGRGSRLDFELAITQPQLGEALGLTPVHVNRTLKALRDQGIMGATGKRYQVLDWERLCALGDFDPVYLLLGGAGRQAA